MKMEKLILERDDTSDKGTFGRIVRDGKTIAFTCELPWRENKNLISCVPKGNYLVVRRKSDKFKNHFWLKDVPGRGFILIHSGNTIEDIEGCILVGEKRGILKGLPAVLQSKITMRKLLKDLPQSFYLQVTGVV